MKVLVLTQLFPNKKQPSLGIFIKERIKEVTELCDLKVVAPVPWFPPLKIFKRWYRFSQIPYHENTEGLEVFHPRFFIIPKIGRSFYGILYFLSVFPYILRLRKGFDFDILDVHWAYPDGFAGVLLGKLLKKPVAVTVRGTDIELFTRYFLLNTLIARTLKHADLVIAVSGALKKKILELGIPKEKVKVIPNGVDTKKFRPIDKTKSRVELELPIEKTIILSVGNLVELKGFHYLINAISEIKKGELNNIFLVIVGEGRFKFELEKQIVKLGLDLTVRLESFKPHEELPKWYSAADLFCLASEREGWPNVILEALACGRPIVATNVGGIPEIIRSQDYGILVKDQDPMELAEAIKRALEKDWDCKKLIEYAQENTWAKCANRISQQFEEVIDNKVVRD